MRIALVLIILFTGNILFAKKAVFRKTQSVDFDGSNVDGEARNPDGAYMLQKRGVKFMPMYKVRKRFDKQIKNSIEFLR